MKLLTCNEDISLIIILETGDRKKNRKKSKAATPNASVSIDQDVNV